MRVAISALRQQNARKIVVATPVAPPTVRWEMEVLVDDFITVVMPTDFYGVGQWYEDFSQIDDDTVYEILRMGAKLKPVEAIL